MLTRSCAVSLPLATKIWLVRSTQLDGLAAEIVVLVYVIELKKKLWVSMCIIVACVGLKKLRLSRWRNLKISLKIFSFNKLDFILKVEVYFSGWLGSNHGIYFWVLLYFVLRQSTNMYLLLFPWFYHPHWVRACVFQN